MKISVYVPCHNNERTMAQVALALRNQTRPPEELLFIDDHCSDRSPSIAREHGFEVLPLGDVYGLAAGRNRAMNRATGDILAGVDADVAVEPDYVQQVLRQFETNANIAALCGRLEEKYTDTVPDLWRSLHMRLNLGDQPVVNPRILFGGTTSCRMEALRRIGGWNPKYKTHYEDVDLSQRLRAAGMNLLYAPSCRAWHMRRDSLEAVLWGFWKYQFDAGDLAGNYDSLASWAKTRLPLNWQFYRNFRLQESDCRPLSYVTLLMPWAMILRDLDTLRSRKSFAGDLAGVVQVARAVLNRCGAEENVVHWAVDFLDRLAGDLSRAAPQQPPLEQELINAIVRAALESIPDANYWQDINVYCYRMAS